MKRVARSACALAIAMLMAGCANSATDGTTGGPSAKETLGSDSAFEAMLAATRNIPVTTQTSVCAGELPTRLAALRKAAPTLSGFADEQLEASLPSVCSVMQARAAAKITESFAAASRAAEAKAEAAAAAKAKKWNDRARQTGYGTLDEMFKAQTALESAISDGAQLSLTGASVEVEWVSCEPTAASTWSDGTAGGWWRCVIDTVGDDSRTFSVEASESGSWGSKADGGDYAGRTLAWYDKIPEALR